MKKLILESSLKFKTWKNNLEKNNIKLNDYEILSLITKKNNEVLFAMLRAEMIAPENYKLPNIVFLRGNFVAVLIHLYSVDTNENFLILVKQRRVATGEFFYEFPAGMIDENSDIFQVAIKEVYEETNIKLQKEQLILLSQTPYYSSPGLLDEAGFYFACKLNLNKSQIMKLNQKNLGNKKENEIIETTVVPFQKAHNLIKNVHGKLHLMLYEKYIEN